MSEENVNIFEVAKLNPFYYAPEEVVAVNLSHCSVPIFLGKTVQLSQWQLFKESSFLEVSILQFKCDSLET